MIYLDTHVAIWLYEGNLNLFSKKALQLIEKKSLAISGMALLEIQYLFEIGRIKEKAEDIIKTLQKEIEISICSLNFHLITEKALQIRWTRDPFDRVIVANAIVNHTQLVTKDKNILKHYKSAVW